MSFKNKFLAKSPLKNYKNPGNYKVFNMGNKPSASLKQVAEDPREVPIEIKPNTSPSAAEDVINKENIEKLMKKYKIDDIEIIENIMEKLDTEAQGDDDYGMIDVEEAVKDFVERRGDENVDEGGIPKL